MIIIFSTVMNIQKKDFVWLKNGTSTENAVSCCHGKQRQMVDPTPWRATVRIGPRAVVFGYRRPASRSEAGHRVSAARSAARRWPRCLCKNDNIAPTAAHCQVLRSEMEHGRELHVDQSPRSTPSVSPHSFEKARSPPKQHRRNVLKEYCCVDCFHKKIATPTI